MPAQGPFSSRLVILVVVFILNPLSTPPFLFFGCFFSYSFFSTAGVWFGFEGLVSSSATGIASAVCRLSYPRNVLAT
ncbi:hypothetical protein BCR44DRAFT_1194890 [Catenaria anguillulae PL171]|uniref:Uncharacterized protein n=1 Tax=Catenaria anguillulae PL171 TaxID=765915 RepID=A0A1Y2HGB3_9FUNG|nr:hypothetical protein BCR44DRAFT_1194890 [Catenaria anguillulae PL171]